MSSADDELDSGLREDILKHVLVKPYPTICEIRRPSMEARSICIVTGRLGALHRYYTRAPLIKQSNLPFKDRRRTMASTDSSLWIWLRYSSVRRRSGMR